MSAWVTALQEHRRHPTFRVQQWAYSREWGFTCECSGEEREWRICITALRDMVPETRASVERLFRHHQRAGSKKRKKDQRRADRKAKALLHRHLTKEQRWQLRGTKAFDVTGQDGRSYLVTEGSCNNVRLIENGRPILSLCIVPDYTLPEYGVRPLPVYDLMLAQKVLLESNIELFLRTARAWRFSDRTAFADAAFLLGEAARPAVEPADIDPQDVDEPAAWIAARLQEANQGDEDEIAAENR